VRPVPIEHGGRGRGEEDRFEGGGRSTDRVCGRVFLLLRSGEPRSALRRRGSRMRAGLLAIPASVLIVGACDLTGPTALPPPRFGRITAVLFNERWTSVPRPDSVVAYYDPATGRLLVSGTRPDARGRDAILALEVCGPPAPGAYRFANTWNGPYGPDRLALGASADYWHPTDLPGVDPPLYTWVTFGSVGNPGDSLVVEDLRLDAGRISGRFRFEARSRGGTYTLVAHGTFWGRVVARPGPCSLDGA